MSRDESIFTIQFYDESIVSGEKTDVTSLRKCCSIV